MVCSLFAGNTFDYTHASLSRTSEAKINFPAGNNAMTCRGIIATYLYIATKNIQKSVNSEKAINADSRVSYHSNIFIPWWKNWRKLFLASPHFFNRIESGCEQTITFFVVLSLSLSHCIPLQPHLSRSSCRSRIKVINDCRNCVYLVSVGRTRLALCMCAANASDKTLTNHEYIKPPTNTTNKLDKRTVKRGDKRIGSVGRCVIANLSHKSTADMCTWQRTLLLRHLMYRGNNLVERTHRITPMSIANW